MSRPAYIRIDLDAVRHNLARVHDFAPGCSTIAMVKANAYGHGYVCVAKALKKATALGVASLEEGLILRQAGITQPVVLIEGVFTPDEIKEADKQGFTLVVHHLYQIDMLERAKVSRPLPVWLKINTGMHRLGIMPHEVAGAYQRLSTMHQVQQPIGLMTHFAESEAMDPSVTKQQIALFQKLTANLPGPRSLANSAGIIAWPEAYGDWVRPGLMLYGASPFPGKTGFDHDLRPVMTAWSRLIGISRISKGAKVGYGGTWAAPEDMLLGVVGFGYGDGYPQFTKSGMPILVNGVQCELAGRVSMDMLTVDLRCNPEAKIGDKVTLWGEGLPVETLAFYANTSPHEIFTRATTRPQVDVVNE